MNTTPYLNNNSILTEYDIGGLNYISKNLVVYVPYVTLFGIGLIAGILGKNQTGKKIV